MSVPPSVVCATDARIAHRWPITSLSGQGQCSSLIRTTTVTTTATTTTTIRTKNRRCKEVTSQQPQMRNQLTKFVFGIRLDGLQLFDCFAYNILLCLRHTYDIHAYI